MKTAELVLYDNTGMLAKNHPSIILAMKEYAREACREQRIICANPPMDKLSGLENKVYVDKAYIINAETPELK